MSSIKHILICFSLLILLPFPSAEAAQPRMALVIGNSDYAVSKLKNPKNDADDMATALEKIGFDVTLAHDLDARGMDKAIRKFSAKLDERGGYGFFYFAGHGVQIEKNNYLIPIDSAMDDEVEVKHDAISVNYILDKMQSTKSSLNLMVLDACRNNPFPSRTRSARGLAALKAQQGSMIVYATAPEAVASDGEGRNGTFTKHFLENLLVPGSTLTEIVRRTKKAVRAATSDGQQPWISSDLTEDRYILYPKPAEELPAPSFDVEHILWDAVLASNTVDQYESYLKTYPGGKFTDLANGHIERLKSSADKQVAVKGKPANNAAEGVSPELQNEIAHAEPVKDTQLAMLGPDVALPKPAPVPTAPELTKALSELTVNAVPNDARVRIMNIVEKYKDGIQLEKNRRYDIFVQKPGYESWRQTVFIDESTTTIDVKLNKKIQLDKVVQADEPVQALQQAQKAENAKKLDNSNNVESVESLAIAPVIKDESEGEDSRIAFQEIQTTRKPAGFNGPPMRSIKTGSFNMGCSPSDSLCTKTESPITPVSISPYQLGESEVTVGEFKQFVLLSGYVTDAEKNVGGYAGCYVRTEISGISRDNARWSWKTGKSWRDPGFKQTDNHPVACVSWNDAVAYTNWLSDQLGHNVRLPTEAEWEYAARAGSTKRFSSSTSSRNLCAYENGADRTASSNGATWSTKMKCRDGYWNTAPVKTFKPNAYGLYDMLGNLHEWTQDVWQASISKQSASNKPNLNGDEDARVLRGGAWDKEPARLRVSARSPGTKAVRTSMIGFRIAHEVAIQTAK